MINVNNYKPILKIQLCTFCNRFLADTFDEGIHNTGECGCIQSRKLCWLFWNNMCKEYSDYDPKFNV